MYFKMWDEKPSVEKYNLHSSTLLCLKLDQTKEWQTVGFTASCFNIFHATSVFFLHILTGFSISLLDIISFNLIVFTKNVKYVEKM